MRLPRWVHQFYAWVMGYFWLPCPSCGRMFGGHEFVWGRYYVKEDGTTWIMCPDCTRRAA